MIKVKFMNGIKNSGKNFPRENKIHIYYNTIYEYASELSDDENEIFDLFLGFIDYVFLIELICMISVQELSIRRHCKNCWCANILNKIYEEKYKLGLVKKIVI